MYECFACVPVREPMHLDLPLEGWLVLLMA